MRSIQIACLLLVMSPANGSWIKEEKFKATGCAAADLVTVDYTWTNVCQPELGKANTFKKNVCGSGKYTETEYTNKICTTATPGSNPVEDYLTCTQDGSEWKLITCGATPPSFGTFTKYMDAACTTIGYSGKFALGVCTLHKSKTNNTWNAGSQKIVMQGTHSNTTGIIFSLYSSNDCTGNSTDIILGSRCSAHGDGFYTSAFVAPSDSSVGGTGTASAAGSIRLFSSVIGFFCMAALVTDF